MAKRLHMPKPREEGGVIDFVTCRCGWESEHLWDGMERALLEWIAHQSEVGVR